MNTFFKELLLRKHKVLVNAISTEELQFLLEKLWPHQVGKDLIRLGSEGDGGYLVPDDLNGLEACFSPGVDKTSAFEEACFKLGMKLFLADASVDEPNLDLPSSSYSFQKKHIGVTNDDRFITLDAWVATSKLDHDADLLLQMDVEGCEYLSLIATSEALLKRFRIIVIEFHDLHNLWEKDFFRQAEATFSKLLQHHNCVHIHPNNQATVLKLNGVEIPNLMEFTFLRNDRFKSNTFETQFPHVLDSDNTEHGSLKLPKGWYQSNH